MKKSVSRHGYSRFLLSSALVVLTSVSLTACRDRDTSKATVQKTETLAHGITLVTVEAQASGKTPDDALQNALILAVEQVNGARVAHALDVRSVIADFSDQSEESVRDSRQTSGDYTSGISVTDRAALDVRTAHKSASSSGIVHAFRIEHQAQSDGLWQIKISAKIAKYKASAISKRLKVAVLPFRKADGAATSGFEARVRDHLVSILSGAGKVAVLDRDYSQENATETSQLNRDAFNKDEAVKLGQRLGADYILVGTVTAGVRTDSVYMKSLGRQVYGDSHAKAKISYRLIEAATGIVQMSGSLDEVAGESRAAPLADAAARKISDRILNTLYPVQVVSISNGVFYLSRGGDSIHVGEHFRIMKQGTPLKDPDTGEVIGATENEVARITVTEVEPKVSKAVLAGKGAVPAFGGSKMIARPYEEAGMSASQTKAAHKIHRLAHKAKPSTSTNAVAGVDF